MFSELSHFSFSILPTIVLSTSVFIRSNGIFWVVVVGLPILESFFINILLLTKGKFSFSVLKNTMFWGIFNIIAVLAPYVIVLKKAEKIYCSPEYFEEKASWCKGILPNVYSFI